MSILIEARHEKMAQLDRLVGVKIVPNPHIPRPGAILDITEGWVYVHPDEEHMVWASLGFIRQSWATLNGAIQGQISRHARHAEEKLRAKTATEIRDEISDRLALHDRLVQD